jgi:hypothetical protein
MQAYVLDTTPAPQIPEIGPLDWMSCLPWLRARRDAILRALWLAGTQLHVADNGLHTARVDALAVFDRRIAELEGRARV